MKDDTVDYCCSLAFASMISGLVVSNRQGTGGIGVEQYRLQYNESGIYQERCVPVTMEMTN